MDEFEQFWAAYPRKTGKGVARKAFAKAMRLTTLDTMLTALKWQRQQEQWVKQGGQFIPHPSTWLNQERWDDQPTQVPTLSEKTTRTFGSHEVPSRYPTGCANSLRLDARLTIQQ